MAWIGIFLYSASAWAQGTGNVSSGIDSLLNPPLLGGEQILYFETPEQQVGDLSEDDLPRTYPFHFWNMSRDTVVLTRVTTSCGCTTAGMDKIKVEPGGKGTVSLVFNPREQAGTLYKTAFVYTTLSTKQPVAKLALVGEVRRTADPWTDYPYALGRLLRMRQRMVRFRDLLRTETRTERVVCVNSGEKPLKLSALLCPPYAKFHTEPEIIAPGEEADLVVTLNGRQLPDSIDGVLEFALVVDGLPGRPSDRTIQVNVSLKEK